MDGFSLSHALHDHCIVNLYQVSKDTELILAASTDFHKIKLFAKLVNG